MSDPIYLDYNATTPVDPAVLEEMLPWFSEGFWNAASAHGPGRRSSAAVEQAREQVAESIGARPSAIYFTSGATEADNLALKGAAEAAEERPRVVIAATEHKAVLDTARWLEEQGRPVTMVPVGRNGNIDIDAYQDAIDDSVAVVSVMLANNETGVVVEVDRLAEIAHAHGALFHTDAAQALGRIEIDVTELGVDLASFSAHKAYGPKGIGALYVARRVGLSPLIHGGGHEKGLRSGTLNVPGIVGFGCAASIAAGSVAAERERQAKLIERLVDALRECLDEVDWIAQDSRRLPNTAMVRFLGADAEAVMAHASDVAVSSGSACTSSVPAPSHVLTAMGLDQEAALECLRFSVGRPTSHREVEEAAVRVARAVEQVRALAESAPPVPARLSGGGT